jgi:RimJ/RimL family protein N-acetyltransferase
MRLETERLELIPMSSDDIELFHTTNIDGYVREHLWDNEIISRDMSLDILATVESIFREDSWGLWKILLKENGTYIGYAGLWRFFGELQPQLLYALLEQYAGNGYASEAAQRVLSYAFEKLGFTYLLAAMNIENVQSVNVCKRLGFSLGEVREIEGKRTYFYRIENTVNT